MKFWREEIDVNAEATDLPTATFRSWIAILQKNHHQIYLHDASSRQLKRSPLFLVFIYLTPFSRLRCNPSVDLMFTARSSPTALSAVSISIAINSDRNSIFEGQSESKECGLCSFNDTISTHNTRCARAARLRLQRLPSQARACRGQHGAKWASLTVIRVFPCTPHPPAAPLPVSVWRKASGLRSWSRLFTPGR